MVRELVEVLLRDVDRTREARTWRIVDRMATPSSWICAIYIPGHS